MLLSLLSPLYWLCRQCSSPYIGSARSPAPGPLVLAPCVCSLARPGEGGPPLGWTMSVTTAAVLQSWLQSSRLQSSRLQSTHCFGPPGSKLQSSIQAQSYRPPGSCNPTAPVLPLLQSSRLQSFRLKFFRLQSIILQSSSLQSNRIQSPDSSPPGSSPPGSSPPGSRLLRSSPVFQAINLQAPVP